MERNYAVHPSKIMATILTATGHTQKWLALNMGVTPAEVNYMLSGTRMVTAEQMVKFCDATGFPVEKLAAIKTDYELFMARKKQHVVQGTVFVQSVSVAFSQRHVGTVAASPVLC
jgi:plasmid maintenance system antidote protein VapI